MEIINKFIKSFTDNPLVNLGFLIFGVIGTILAIKTYLTIKPKKAFNYLNIISDTINKYDKLSTLYDGQVIESFSKTELFFWNAGKKTLKNTDLFLEDPLRIQLKEKGIEIYKLEYITTNRIKDFFALNMNEQKNSFEMKLNSMAKNDGIFVQIYHSGKEDDIDILGEIEGTKGIKKVLVFNDFSVFFNPNLKKSYYNITISIIFTLCIGLLLLNFFISVHHASVMARLDTLLLTSLLIPLSNVDRMPKELMKRSKEVNNFRKLDITKKSFNQVESKDLKTEEKNADMQTLNN